MKGFLSRLVPYALSFFSSLCIMVLELVASRLVAQHVGGSLIVWTSVIGIILAGICLGNVLGGRLADRVEPRMALSTLYALGALLTLGCLWINAYVGFVPGLDSMAWNLRTVVVVTLDFLVPATVLGMISPVVAKMAVMQSKRAGSAIGDIYFWGAVGSIVGTFLAGFWLIYIAPTSTIVAVVAAALALLAFALSTEPLPRWLGLASALLLLMGALPSMGVGISLPDLPLIPLKLSVISAIGHLLALGCAITAWFPLAAVLSIAPVKQVPRVEIPGVKTHVGDEKVKLSDLATLAFVASLAFMALEMVAGRLVTRHTGSSVYGWTSVIGVLLGGLSVGNYLGGKLADHVKSEKAASILFLAASAMVLTIILLEHPQEWMVTNPIGYLFGGESPRPIIDDPEGLLHVAGDMAGFPWWFRVLFLTGVQFFLPAVSMGTVSPLVAKLAVDRVRKTGRTGSAIGSVYAWGMVGSLVGTFLTGFLLIDLLGTKGVVLVIATLMAVAATALGSVWHAIWAGIPLGFCVIAFLPPFIPTGFEKELRLPGKRLLKFDSTAARDFLIKHGESWGLREPQGDPDNPNTSVAYIDESNYYYIKVNNESLAEEGIKRTLVLDNLIHGYEILGNPKRLDYDYEHIYAIVTHRVMQAKAASAAKSDLADGPSELGVLFLGGGSYTFPRYLQATYPRAWCEIAEIDPAVTRANHNALGLPWPEATFPIPRPDPRTGNDVLSLQRKTIELGPTGSEKSRMAYLEALSAIAPAYRKAPASDTAEVMLDGRLVPLGPYGSEASINRYLELVADRFATSKYRIRTTWGDARQYVVKHQDMRFDVVYGDAFNDFSVPWHLTTKEFNDLLANMISPEGLYMINIIDVFETDGHAAEYGPRRILEKRIENALRNGWSGEPNPRRLARTAANRIDTGELSDAWAQLGRWADQASEAETAVAWDQPFDQIAASLRRQQAASRETEPALPTKSEFTPPSADELTDEVERVLSDARVNEALSLFDQTKASTIRRLEKDEELKRAIEQGGFLDTVRSDAYAQKHLGERVRSFETNLASLIETARAISLVAPDELTDAVNKQSARIIEEFEGKTMASLRAKMNLDLLDQLTRSAARVVGGSTDEITLLAARTQAVRLARQLVNELERVRSDLSSRLHDLQSRAQGDSNLARAAGRDAHQFLSSRDDWIDAAARDVQKARSLGGFLGSWVKTAQDTFPHIYVYGTDDDRGNGQRETFVVVASKQPIDLAELGTRAGDPEFFVSGRRTEPAPFNEKELKALEVRSRGLKLTDDHAPVENLLAPVAETRGD